MVNTLSPLPSFSIDPSGPRVQSFAAGDGKIWVKQAVAQKATWWHGLQNAMAKIIPLRILRRTAGQGGAQNLAAEAERLQKISKAGFHVPVVHAVTPDYIVLSDAGTELKATLDRMSGLDERWPLLVLAARTLGDLHMAGYVHGRPHLKDFVYDVHGPRIGFLDFEEDPLDVMPSAQARARDIWLFLGSAARFVKDTPERLDDLYDAYRDRAGRDHEEALRRLVRLLRPLRWAIQHTVVRFAGKDVRQAIMANYRLEKILTR
jgi:tRNA A-37 threonylcarbamoyl transferase component Bud32